MAYDEGLAERIRAVLGPAPGLSERKMFGGIAFLKNDKMFIGIVKNDLMVRVGPERYADALAEPHARPMDFNGRPAVGYVYVGPEGCRTDAMLESWVERATTFVETLIASRKAVGKS